ncbi:MAG: lanthionine synthetase C family protein, partial [Acidobacteria bacterium]|nr:lanthionine synthetase C family protein [Acidobacteriota bacterium]
DGHDAAGAAAKSGGQALAEKSAGQALAEKAAAGQALAAEVNRALDEIATALQPPGTADADAAADAADAEPGGARAQSLADGPAGKALFFHYLDQARPGQGHDERALAHLEAAIAATSEAATVPGLYSGFSGTAWVLEHLTGRLLEVPAPGEDDPGEEVAAALASYLEHSPWLEDYDLISGLAGLGVWAVERAPRSRGEEAVQSVTRRLGELAERRDGGITWLTPPERMLASEAIRNPQGLYNLGVAHGVPGVIGVLGEMVAAGLAPEEARELLAGAVAWLLRQVRPAGSAGSAGSAGRFGYSVTPGAGEAPPPARLAWCYGDPGIAAALLVAARAAGEPEWERQAVATAEAAAARPRDDGGVMDGGLCHGAAGLAHLYNRIFQATGEPAFKTEALAWLERLMALRQPGEGIAGWRAWRPIGDLTVPEPVLGWVTDPGLLTGATGIGLALLGAISPVEPAWDRILLSSVPPRPAGGG